MDVGIKNLFNKLSHDNATDGHGHALLIHAMSGVGWDEISAHYKRIDFPATMEADMYVQLTGERSGEQFFASVWSDADSAVEFYQRSRGELDAVMSTGDEVTLERERYDIVSLLLGSRAAQYDGRRSTGAELFAECFEVQDPLIRYPRFLELLRIREDPPRGLVAHVAARGEDSGRILDVWESKDAAREFFQKRLMPAGLTIARETGDVPVVSPTTIDVHIFAVNPATLHEPPRLNAGVPDFVHRTDD